MSKKMTAVILRQLHTDLNKAIQEARELLPPQAEVERKLPVFGIPYKSVPALNPIIGVLNNLEDHIQTLTKETKE